VSTERKIAAGAWAALAVLVVASGVALWPKHGRSFPEDAFAHNYIAVVPGSCTTPDHSTSYTCGPSDPNYNRLRLLPSGIVIVEPNKSGLVQP
jgi:hypothetical protein